MVKIKTINLLDVSEGRTYGPDSDIFRGLKTKKEQLEKAMKILSELFTPVDLIIELDNGEKIILHSVEKKDEILVNICPENK